jgi:hypothetical protein
MKKKIAKTKIPKVKYVYIKPKNEQEAEEFNRRVEKAFDMLFTETMRLRNLKKLEEAEKAKECYSEENIEHNI